MRAPERLYMLPAAVSKRWSRDPIDVSPLRGFDADVAQQRKQRRMVGPAGIAEVDQRPGAAQDGGKNQGQGGETNGVGQGHDGSKGLGVGDSGNQGLPKVSLNQLLSMRFS